MSISHLKIFNQNKRSIDQAQGPLEGLNTKEKRQKTERLKKIQESFNQANKTKHSSEEPLTQIYQLKKPQQEDQAVVFFAIRNALKLIESWLNDHPLFTKAEKIRKMAKSSVHASLSFAEKMSELGLIYYYLDKDQDCPLAPSLISHFAQEKSTEMETLKQAYKKSEAAIPSGRMHHLLCTFAKLIVSSTQKFNQGGTYALIQLLENVDLGMLAYLREEHRSHILHIARELALKPQFKVLLEKKIVIHPDLESLIRLDFKLSEDASITTALIVQDCLMALFFDIKQTMFEANCYAIAALIYAKENALYKVLSFLLDHLQQGRILIDGQSLPLLPLLENRLSNDQHLLVLAKEKKVFSAAPFQDISYALKLKTKPAGNETKLLFHILENFLALNGQEDKLLAAKRLFHSFSANALVLLLSSILEFRNVTNQRIKNDFINKSLDKILHSFNRLFASHEVRYFMKVREILASKIWLVNHSEPLAFVTDGTLNVGPLENRIRVENFSGSLEDLAEVFRESCSLYCYDSGSFFPVRKISDYILIIELCSESALLDFLSEEGADLSTTVNAFQLFLKSARFSSFIAELLAEQINKSGIKKEHLETADLLILAQEGGGSSLNVLNIAAESKEFSSYTALDFLEKLALVFKDIPDEVKEKTHSFLAMNIEHFFIITPHSCRNLWKASDHFKHFAENIFFSPARKLLEKKLPKEVGLSIIRRHFSKNIQERTRFIQILNIRKNFTYDSFHNFLSKHVKVKNKAQLKKILDEEYYKIEISVKSLNRILKALDYPLDIEKIRQLESQLRKKMPERCAPFILAKKLSQFLAEHKVGLCPSYIVEKAICSCFGLPEPIQIGDLIWGDREGEYPKHCLLAIRFHFGHFMAKLFLRESNTEILLDNKEFSQTCIQFPKI